ncbi:MAG: DUF839 domain-containing protein [Actinomycetia bacterium]|nr:DUF839 domain-containing protein [Actinomycetes bacterium]
MGDANEATDERVRIDRRGLFRWAGAAGMLGVAGAVTSCVAPWNGSGVTLPGVAGAVELPAGFTVRTIALGGVPIDSNGYSMPGFPDGAATFADPAVAGGWYLVVNHELPADGGVSSFRFAPDGTLLGASRILSGTTLNCAGGPTPWGTWLSCEEYDWGRVWECDPTGSAPPAVRPAMGSFAHEAAAVAGDGRVYMTEDRGDGGFYRFTPSAAGDLTAGLLEVATGTAPGPVAWVEVPDPTGLPTLTRDQVPSTMTFDGGEGIDTLGDKVWFTTKGDDRVWEYSVAGSAVSLRYQGGGASMLADVDNLWVDDPSATLLVAEDGDDMQVVAIRPDNSLFQVVRVVGQEGSEIAGPCFSPDGQRLYFSSQRAQVGAVGSVGLPLGATYEVSGPFDTLLSRP